MSTRPELDWHELESSLTALVCRALETIDTSPDDPVYAVALHSVYRELDGPISLPLLAANTSEGSPPPDQEGFWGARWNPADWALEEILLPDEEALTLEKAITAEATSGSPAHWRATWRRYRELLVRVTRTLSERAPSIVPLTDDAVVFWFDGEGGHQLARETISEELFARLFAPQVAVDQQRATLAAQPPRQQAEYLVTRLGLLDGITSEMAQRDLLALGAEAVPSLLGALESAANGWIAAKLLGEIGQPTDEVLAALRAGVDQSLWHPIALGMLGDHAWLARQPARIACLGLTAPLRGIAYQDGVSPPRLDYGPLEDWLEGGGGEATELAEKELQPGRGYVTITVDDADEALRGLSSRHPVVRWHAASMLGNRGLGDAAGARVLPALAAALADPHPYVRRLGVLALGRWKATAQPYRHAIAALTEDPDEVVRNVAAHVLGRL